MKRFLILFLTVLAFNVSPAQYDGPSDRLATKETVNLYHNMKIQLQRGVMFGHQDDLAYGVGWQYQDGRSDIKDVTGDYPAVYGWELGHLEIDKPVNLDSVPFNTMQQLIRQGYERGGIITISWHLNNPLTGKTAWDPAEGTVASILPGGSKHDLYKSWLDKIATFMNGLKGSKGEMIPVLFRPFHELNGNWFWWGGKNCTPNEFKALWWFTVNYLRNEKKLHHLLYVYNTDRFDSPNEYFAKYPGNEFVDVMGFDIYQRDSPNEKFMDDLNKMLTILVMEAAANRKIPALTEFGGNLTDHNWWTGAFLKVLRKHQISYALGWRNAGAKSNGTTEYYVPYKGEGSEADFKKFYKADRTIFQKEISRQKIYE